MMLCCLTVNNKLIGHIFRAGALLYLPASEVLWWPPSCGGAMTAIPLGCGGYLIDMSLVLGGNLIDKSFDCGGVSN